MDNIDIEFIVVALALLVFVTILVCSARKEKNYPTTGEGWIEVIKRERR